MKTKFIYILLAISALAITGCSSQNDGQDGSEQALTVQNANMSEAYKYIPSDARALVKLNINNMLVKSDILNNAAVKEELQQENLRMQEKYGKECDLAGWLADPSKVGIDVNTEWVIAYGQNRALIYFPISDIELFNAHSTQYNDPNDQITTRGEVTISINNIEHYVAVNNDNLCILSLLLDEDGSDVSKREVNELVNLISNGNNFAGAGLQSFIDAKDDVAIWVAIKDDVKLIANLNSGFRKFTAFIYPVLEIEDKDIEFAMASFNFENQAVTFNCNIGKEGTVIQASAQIKDEFTSENLLKNMINALTTSRTDLFNSGTDDDTYGYFDDDDLESVAANYYY